MRRIGGLPEDDGLAADFARELRNILDSGSGHRLLSSFSRRSFSIFSSMI